MRILQASAVLLLGMVLASCGGAGDKTAETSVGGLDDLLEIIGGMAVQGNIAMASAAFANSLGGTGPNASPADTDSYVGSSKAFAPGIRLDLYYIAIPGSNETVGRVLCLAPAALTADSISGYSRTERLLVTEVYGEDTCGWNLAGDAGPLVYAWDSATKTLRLWVPSAETPADIGTAPGTDFLKLCENPTIPLTGRSIADHPPSVCDLDALFGPGGFTLSHTPWEK